ncbi:MAG: hypothetical protein AAFZ01_05785 [Pseudomonadota bacterium]
MTDARTIAAFCVSLAVSLVLHLGVASADASHDGVSTGITSIADTATGVPSAATTGAVTGKCCVGAFDQEPPSDDAECSSSCPAVLNETTLRDQFAIMRTPLLRNVRMFAAYSPDHRPKPPRRAI